MPGDAALLLQARQLMAVNRPADAVPLLRQAIAAAPEMAAPRCELALALHSLGQNAAALKEVERALTLEPESEWPHRLRSIVLRSLGRTQDAITEAREAVRLAPIPETLHTLGAALLAAGKVKEAATAGDHLVRLAPSSGLAHQFVGLVAIKRKDWKGAEAASRAALEIDPLDQPSLNNLGVALQGQKRWRDALEIYQRAAQLNPSDEVARRNIVHLVRPVSGHSMTIDFVRAVIVPWSIPIVLGQNLVRFVRSRQRQRALRPGATMFYQQEAWRGWPIHPGWFLAGITLFVVGYIAIAVAQNAGWTFVTTGIPVSVLAVVSALLALFPLAKRGTRALGKRLGLVRNRTS